MVFSFTFKNNSVFIERFYGGNNILGDLLKSEVVNSKMILSFIFLNLIVVGCLPALFPFWEMYLIAILSLFWMFPHVPMVQSMIWKRCQMGIEWSFLEPLKAIKLEKNVKWSDWK